MTNADPNSITGLYVTYFNRAADPAGFEFWVDQANAGASLETIATAFASSPEALSTYPYLAFPNTSSPAQFVNEIYENAFGRPADPEGLAFWVGQLEAGADPSTFILQLVTSASPNDAAVLQNRANVANRFREGLIANNITPTDTLLGNSSTIIDGVDGTEESVIAANAQVDSVIAAASQGSGQTFVFTTGIDNLQGAAKNDIFIGDNSTVGNETVQAADQVNGGGGDDTFRFFGSSSNVLPTLVDVETLELVGPTGAALNTYDFSGLSDKGLKNVVVGGNPGGDFTAKGLSGIALGATVTNAINVTGDFDTASEATFLVSGAAKVKTVTLNGAAIKTVNLKAEGTNNVIDDIVAGGGIAETLNISGGGAVKVTQTLDDTIETINASQNKGGVNLKAGKSDLTFTGGSGNDALTIAGGQLTSQDVLDGGAGKDTLIIGETDLVTAADDQLKAINASKNFEILGFNGAGAKVDVSTITAFKDYLFQGGGNVVVTNATDTTTFTFDKSAALFDVANASKQTVINLTLVGDGIKLADMKTNAAADTLNVVSSSGGADGAAANEITKFTGDQSGLKIVVTGDKDLTLGTLTVDPVTGTGVTIDASALKGDLKAQGSGKQDFLTGGSGNDTLTGGLVGDELTGGAGIDTFNFGVGAADSNAGVLTGIVSFDTITDFVVADDKLQSTLFKAGNLADQALIQAQVDALDDSATLQAALNTASNVIGVGKYGAFSFNDITYVLADGDGDATTAGAMDLLVALDGKFTLTGGNFIM